MAFVRRRGNWFYQVHNVRRGGKVRQLHLARLGDRARITDDVVREVSRRHPFVDLNWPVLRERTNQQASLTDRSSPVVPKFISVLRALNRDRADLFPRLLRISESAAAARELHFELRLLQSIIQVKIGQLNRGRSRGRL